MNLLRVMTALCQWLIQEEKKKSFPQVLPAQKHHEHKKQKRINTYTQTQVHVHPPGGVQGGGVDGGGDGLVSRGVAVG